MLLTSASNTENKSHSNDVCSPSPILVIHFHTGQELNCLSHQTWIYEGSVVLVPWYMEFRLASAVWPWSRLASVNVRITSKLGWTQHAHCLNLMKVDKLAQQQGIYGFSRIHHSNKVLFEINLYIQTCLYTHSLHVRHQDIETNVTQQIDIYTSWVLEAQDWLTPQSVDNEVPLVTSNDSPMASFFKPFSHVSMYNGVCRISCR